MKKGIQHFDPEYLKRCQKMSAEEILQFLEDYRNLIFNMSEKCQPISLKVEPSLLNAFKREAQLEGVPYQTKIKQLMREWVQRPSRRV